MKINKNKSSLSMIVTSMLLLVSWVILLWSSWGEVIAAWWWVYSWIMNRAEYLTWMEVYNKDWGINSKILIKTVESWWEIRLDVEWAINAAWLIVWGTNKWVNNNSVLWGEDSVIDNETNGGINTGVKNNIIIWWARNGNRESWTNNAQDLVASVIIWWADNLSSEWYKLWILWSKWTLVRHPKDNDVVIWWEKEAIDGNKVLVVWLGESSTDENKDNEAREENIIMWNNVRPLHVENGYEGVSKIFVWNGSWEVKPNIGWWFYVYPKNWVWVNNENPKVMLDGSELWWLLITWDDNKEIEDLECNANSAWTIMTVSRGDWTAMCGCDGEKWYALKEDEVSIYVCAGWVPPEDMVEDPEEEWWELEKDPEWDKYCVLPYEPGTNTLIDINTVVLHNGENGTPNTYWSPRWSREANGWSWWWVWLKWTYGWVENVAWTARECVYECARWYYPNAESPIGWYQSSCISCTWDENTQWPRYTWWASNWWKSAWDKKNNCDYSCKWWFVYNPEKRTCDPAPIGTYTEEDNQDLRWKDCNIPAKVYLWAQYAVWAGTTVYEEEWEDPYFWKFTSSWTNINSCEYECAPWYFKYYSRSKYEWAAQIKLKSGTDNYNLSWNLCISAPVWTYTNWKEVLSWNVTLATVKTWRACTNRWYTLSYEDWTWKWVQKYAYYTSHGWTVDGCEWNCDETKWLIKWWVETVSWKTINTCTCWEWMHFDPNEKKCVSNMKVESCSGWSEIPENAIKWIDRVVKMWNASTKWWEVTYPANKNTAWVWQDTSAEWVGCAWSCPVWTVRNNNVCKVIVDSEWKCATTYNYNWIRLTNWLNGKSNLITETTFKSMSSAKFCERWTVSDIKYFNTSVNKAIWEWTWKCTNDGITVNCGTLQTRNAECEELVNWKNKERGCKLVDTSRAFQVAWIATGVQNLMSPTRNVKKWLEWNCLAQNDGNDIAHNSANNNNQVVCFTCETYYHRTYTASTSKISNITAHHGSCTPDEYSISFDANSFKTIPYDSNRLWEEKYKGSNPNTVTSYNIDTNTLTLWDASSMIRIQMMDMMSEG